jgi:phosphate transport system permease protein
MSTLTQTAVNPVVLERELSQTLYEGSSNRIESFVHVMLRLVASSTIVLVLLIFVFVAWQCLPILLQETDNSRSGQILLPDQVAQKTPAEIAAFLKVDESKVKGLRAEVIQELVQSRDDELSTSSNPDSKVNTTSWSKLLLPYQWSGGNYKSPVYLWQPTGEIEKYNIIPPFLGSIKVALVALIFACPLSLISAVYVSQMARSWVKELVKPAIELMAGIPTVVLGFLGWILLVPVFSWAINAPPNHTGSFFHDELNGFIHVMDPSATSFNALVAGMVLALAVTPVIFTIAEDAISAVPSTHRDAARALGSTDWFAAVFIVVPAALPGIFAAIVLGFGRAVGETMIVLLVSGNAASMDLSLLKSTKTVAATIAGEITDAPQDSDHYRILFLLGLLLFIITFFGNVIADLILQRLKARLEGQLSLEEKRALTRSTVV